MLMLDPLWKSFLQYIQNNGGWIGPEIQWESADDSSKPSENGQNRSSIDMNVFSRRIESLTMKAASDDEKGDIPEGEEEVDANIDRPWRDLE